MASNERIIESLEEGRSKRIKSVFNPIKFLRNIMMYEKIKACKCLCLVILLFFILAWFLTFFSMSIQDFINTVWIDIVLVLVIICILLTVTIWLMCCMYQVLVKHAFDHKIVYNEDKPDMTKNDDDDEDIFVEPY